MSKKLNPRNILVVFMFIMSAAGCGASVAADSLELVVDGRPRTTIVLAEKPASSAQLAEGIALR